MKNSQHGHEASEVGCLFGVPKVPAALLFGHATFRSRHGTRRVTWASLPVLRGAVGSWIVGSSVRKHFKRIKKVATYFQSIPKKWPFTSIYL